jgi:hypothetical protein
VQISKVCFGDVLLVTALNRCTAADGCREQPLLAVILQGGNDIAPQLRRSIFSGAIGCKSALGRLLGEIRPAPPRTCPTR